MPWARLRMGLGINNRQGIIWIEHQLDRPHVSTCVAVSIKQCAYTLSGRGSTQEQTDILINNAGRVGYQAIEEADPTTGSEWSSMVGGKAEMIR